jgi:hypothetical protein
MHNDLGFIDVEQKALQPLRHRVVVDLSGTFRYLCLRSGQPDHVQGATIGGGDYDLNPRWREPEPERFATNNWPPTFGADLHARPGPAGGRAVFYRGQLFWVDAIGRKL